jgi:hypothetical protein
VCRARSTQCTHENLLTSVASVLFLGIIEFVRLLDCGDRLVEYNQARIKLVSMAFKHHLLTTCSHASRRNKRESKVLLAVCRLFVLFPRYAISTRPPIPHQRTFTIQRSTLGFRQKVSVCSQRHCSNHETTGLGRVVTLVRENTCTH